jgi:hypothetical protein
MKAASAWLALVLFSASITAPLLAQDDGIGAGRRGASVFAEFSAARPGQGESVVWGGSGGGYIQGRILGFAARATALPSNSGIRLYSAVVGPRIAISLPMVRAFVEAGGGTGYTNYYNGLGESGASWGAAWQADAGVSHGILPRVDWRILEVAYGHIYVGQGISPAVASTGLTLHLW